MANKKIRIKFTNLFLLVIIIYIIVQIVIWTIGYFTKVLVLDKEDISLRLNERGLVVIKENLIKSEDDGIIKYNVNEYEKVQMDKELFTISKSGNNKKIDEEIKILKKEIEKLEKNENKKKSILLNKKEELKILKNQKKVNYIDYKASNSGIISFSYDNFTKINVNQMQNLNSKILNSTENNFNYINKKEHRVKKGQVLLRIIDQNEVYICIFLKKDILEEGQSVKIVANEEEIDAIIQKIYKKQDGNLVVIKIMEQNPIIYNTRVQEFGIIYKKIQGFKIPKESVVENNNSIGVYVIDEENKIPQFVKIGKNYYKDEKYYYVDYNKNKDENNLNLYDRILLYPNFINKNIKVSR